MVGDQIKTFHVDEQRAIDRRAGGLEHAGDFERIVLVAGLGAIGKARQRDVRAELCPDRDKPGHRHNRACEDRVRLAARQHYQSLRRNFRRYLAGDVKKP